MLAVTGVAAHTVVGPAARRRAFVRFARRPCLSLEIVFDPARKQVRFLPLGVRTGPDGVAATPRTAKGNRRG
jgi:hypothetical protein